VRERLKILCSLTIDFLTRNRGAVPLLSGEVRKEASKWLERAKLYREQADYGHFYIVSVNEAEAQIQSAREFRKPPRLSLPLGPTRTLIYVDVYHIF
jgi:hypothetical protein